jgi:hypothetical protein
MNDAWTFRDERLARFHDAIYEMSDSLDRGNDMRAAAMDFLCWAIPFYESLDFPLYESVDGRSVREVRASALRNVANSFEQSWVAKTAMKMLGLEKVHDLGLVYADRVANYSRVSQLLERQAWQHDEHLGHAMEVAASFDALALTPCRLYASYKTWPTIEELHSTTELIHQYSCAKIELVLEGPVKLFLQLGSDGFTLIWKALMMQNGSHEPKMRDTKVLSGNIFDFIQHHANEGFIKELTELSLEAVDISVNTWLQEQVDRRSFVPENSRERFFTGFEQGKYFALRCAENAQEEK